MTPAELTLTAALGSSALTGAASLGVIWVREWRRGKASDRAALRAAVTELLSRSMAVAMRARTMGEAMKFRSGLKEGLDVTLRQRKPADPLELHDWMAQDLAPLNTALSELWTRADQEGVRLANEVVSRCMDVLGATTARQQADSGRERVRRWALGERWTPAMIAENDRAVKELAHARKRFADYARARLGHEAVELFMPPDSKELPAGPEAEAVIAADGTAVNGAVSRAPS
jgi:hypothetical protein